MQHIIQKSDATLAVDLYFVNLDLCFANLDLRFANLFNFQTSK